MNFRGVANSTYSYAINNKKILKNKSIIFYNKNNYRNKLEVIKKFKKKFTLISISNFKEIDLYEEKFNLDYIYVQKGGNKDEWYSANIKTLVHVVYPQKLNQIHGYNYVYISEWLSNKFSNKKIPYVPLIINSIKNSSNLRKKLKIRNNDLVFGCHGGESSFDMKFVQSAIINTVKKRKDIYFIFLNIDKFYKHPQIIFLKGTSNDHFKNKFLNTCDAMIYGRSLGESFGLACAEFAFKFKDIFSYKFNRHQSHKYNLPNKNYHEYSSYKSLHSLINNYQRKKRKLKYKSKYLNYTAKKTMKNFENVFLKNYQDLNFSFLDYLINYKNHIYMNYLYLRHKIYIYFFNYFYFKFL